MDAVFDQPMGEGAAPPLTRDAASVGDLVDRAMVRYLDSRRAKIDVFVDQTYSFSASLKVHKRAFGADILRAPANALLAAPQAAILAAGWGLGFAGRYSRRCGRLSSRLGRTTLLLPTDVTRELTFRLYRDFLELPFEDGDGRVCSYDALTDELMRDPRLARLAAETWGAVATRADDPAFRARLQETLAVYTGTRAAAADLVSSMTCLGVGLALTHHFTPGTWGLSSLLSSAAIHKAALGAAPVGVTLGVTSAQAALPFGASAAIVVGTTGAVMGAASVVAAFAGVIADPLQRALGLHRRRLERLVGVMEKELLTGEEGQLGVRDHYVARVFDFIDMMVALRALAFKPA